MKAVILNGSTKAEIVSNTVFDIVTALFSNRDIETDLYVLRDVKISSCAGCFGCWVKSPGICQIDDDGRVIARAVIQSDLLVGVTPVVFGCYAPLLKKALERLTPNLSPFFQKAGSEIHHRKRYDSYPSLLMIGVMPEPDDDALRIFSDLVRRNAVNLHSPAWTAGIVGGKDPERLKSQVNDLITQAKVIK